MPSGGTARRKLSEEEGLKVWLCPEHHRGNSGVHMCRVMDLYIKQEAQRAYEKNHTREEFMNKFRRNYLDEEE